MAVCRACGKQMVPASLPRHRKYHCHSPNTAYVTKPKCPHCCRPVSRPGHTLKRHTELCPARPQNGQARKSSARQCQPCANNNQDSSVSPAASNVHIPSTATSPPLSPSQDTTAGVYHRADTSRLQFSSSPLFPRGFPGRLVPGIHPPPQPYPGNINQHPLDRPVPYTQTNSYPLYSLPVGANLSIQPLPNMPRAYANEDYFRANPSAHSFLGRMPLLDTSFPRIHSVPAPPRPRLGGSSRHTFDDLVRDYAPAGINPSYAMSPVGANLSIQPASDIPMVLNMSDENHLRPNLPSDCQPTAPYDDQAAAPPPPAHAITSAQGVLPHDFQDKTGTLQRYQ